MKKKRYSRIVVLLVILVGVLLFFRFVKQHSKDASEIKGNIFLHSIFENNEQTENSNRLVKNISVLVSDGGGRVDWSHTNDKIAFSKMGEDKYRDIYTMNPDGTNQICLTCSKSQIPQLSNDQPAWHPDGEWIVFQSQDPNLQVGSLIESLPAVERQLTQGGAGLNNNLWLVSADGSKFHQLTYIKDKEATLHPHFSHDGTKLFWAARVRDRFQYKWVLKVADFINGVTPRLGNEKTYHPVSGYEFYESHGFSLDNSKIIFSASPSDRRFDLDIFMMDLHSQQVTNLTNSPGEWDEHAIISPDGKKLVWISSHGYEYIPSVNYGSSLTTDYWLMNIDGSEKQRLTYFNEKNYSEYTGSRTIVADSSWNKSGDKIVALIMVTGRKTESKIVVIELKNH